MLPAIIIIHVVVITLLYWNLVVNIFLNALHFDFLALEVLTYVFKFSSIDSCKELRSAFRYDLHIEQFVKVRLGNLIIGINKLLSRE